MIEVWVSKEKERKKVTGRLAASYILEKESEKESPCGSEKASLGEPDTLSNMMTTSQRILTGLSC